MRFSRWCQSLPGSSAQTLSLVIGQEGFSLQVLLSQPWSQFGEIKKFRLAPKGTRTLPAACLPLPNAPSPSVTRQ